MANRIEFKNGDKVRHKFSHNKYQHCTVVEIEEGCNGRIKVICEDGFYGRREESAFCPQDLEKPRQ